MLGKFAHGLYTTHPLTFTLTCWATTSAAIAAACAANADEPPEHMETALRAVTKCSAAKNGLA